MATLENRGNGTWRITISGGYGPDGKQIRVRKKIKVDPMHTEGSQRKEAEREAAKLQADYDRHLITAEKKIKLSALAEDYLDSKRITETTKSGYRVLLDGRILPDLGNESVQDLSPVTLRKFFKNLSKADAFTARSKTGKLSEYTQLHYYRLLNALMNYAIKSGYITVNPMAAVDAPRKDTPETDYYQPEEIASLLDVLENLPDPMWKAYFILSLYSCCRPGELIGANWSDLKGNELYIAHGAAFIKGTGTIRTPTPKNHSSIRKIYLTPEVLEPLKKWHSIQLEYRLKIGNAWAEPDAMFTGVLGRRLHIGSPTQKWAKILKAYNLRHVPLYALRHTGASLLIAEGQDVKSVSKRLGHSTPTLTLSTYSHAFENAEKKNASIIASAIAAARKKAL